MLPLDTRLRRRDDEIVAKVMDGEAVIINLANGLYYSTDQVGGTIWSMIEDGHRLGDIIATIAARYDVASDQARDDALRLAAALLENELVSAMEQEPADVPAYQPEPPAAPKLPYTPPQLCAYTDMEDLLALDPPTPGLGEIPWKE